MSHVKILETYNDIPLLILEDDAKITKDFNPILEVPNDIDSVYVGTSSGNPYYMTKNYNDTFFRIGNVLSTHAVLYLSEKFKKAVAEVTKLFVYQYQKPVDIGVASILQHFKVLAPKKPYFVQADERNSNNKWEFITARPLENKNSMFPDEFIKI
jgi:GR25 family glycosyltransferase involved in LPS biosynthesis